MQIFEVFEIVGFPYMETKEVISGEKVRDILTEENAEKVYLLVDHDEKRIWTYNGNNTSFRLQVFGGILAVELRKQLKLFYRVFSLNAYPKDSKQFIQVLDKQMGGGRAQPITKDSFSGPMAMDNISGDLSLHPGLNASKAIEEINQLPKLNDYLRRFMIVGNNLYSDEEITESFLKEEKTISKVSKLGPINRGFTFFGDANYSLRLFVKDRKVQGVELFVNKEYHPDVLKLDVPIIYEEKISRVGDINDVIKAFQIPDELPEEEEN